MYILADIQDWAKQRVADAENTGRELKPLSENGVNGFSEENENNNKALPPVL